MQPHTVLYVWNLRQDGGNPELCYMGKTFAGQKHVGVGGAGWGAKSKKKLTIAD